jgi:N-acetylmuramoyl-L-alanine amidase
VAAQESARAALDAWVAAELADAPAGLRYDGFLPPGSGVAAVEVGDSGARVIFNTAFGNRIWRPEEVTELDRRVRTALGAFTTPETPIAFFVRMGGRNDATDYPLADFATGPESIRRQHAMGSSVLAPLAHPVVERSDYAGPARRRGLQGRTIFVSAAHGWTWHKENRWQLQRARVYTIVEDMFPAAFVNPFLIPMLENAGAVVFSARERDYQVGEVIVDNDGADTHSRFRAEGTWTAQPGGWKGGRPVAVTEHENPFTPGTTWQASLADETAEAVYIPYIPHAGRYAVYLSWQQSPTNSPSVPVEILHAGGTTTVRVNQQVSGHTWVFAGFFGFEQGANEQIGSVRIRARGALASDEAQRQGLPTTVSIDAVRFGGGMGNVATGHLISGKPRHAEGALYWLQYSGAPHDTVLRLARSEGHFGLDYNHDITVRGEWPNYLQGTVNGAMQAPGLGVPIDAVIGWHTDAGYSQEGIIGTLSIYRLRGSDGRDLFPDGRSRMLNRHLAALVQDEIMRTAREHYSSTWPKRHLRDGDYGEARRPNSPSVLLELLSHHNFNDMKYGLDPRFQFDISRAVYKGILRFVAASHGTDVVIAPLAPQRLAARLEGDGRAVLTWHPRHDPLEPTAAPAGYIVYRSTDGRAFDNGTFVPTPRHSTDPIETGAPVYFRVTAVNDGGESFPTPVVGVCRVEGSTPLLVVDGFDRVAAPAILEAGSARGFDRTLDPGLGYGEQYALVGNQYDFWPRSDWANDLETPGWGGSQSALENTLVPGNTFDHVVAYGQALAAAGRAFDSCTADAYGAGDVPAGQRPIIWIAGRQRSTPPPAGLDGIGRPDRMRIDFEVLSQEARARLQQHVANGGALILSGAYVAEDLLAGPLASASSRAFAREVLGIESFESRATRINALEPTMDNGRFVSLNPCRFGLDLEWPINIARRVLPVESAEALTPAARGEVVLLYPDTRKPAAVVTGRVAVAGFPLETVLPEASRQALLGAFLGAVEQPKESLGAH